ncbi:MAG: ethanolamine ammonia-lyase subunit EutC, partial [Maribacter sp.]
VGTGLPLTEVLALKHAHALAKDAIVTQLDLNGLQKKSEEFQIPCQVFKSKVQDRLEYLKRPDLGRRLHLNSNHVDIEKVDILFVITDGLSATAVNKYAIEVLGIIITEIKKKYKVAIAMVEQGRVAIGDEVAELYKADFVAVLIGERPGLSSPESMGIYTTYQPKLGLTDERRNCISNIHADGLSAQQGSTLLKYLINRSFALQLSGVALKIEVGDILENK